MQIKMSLTNGSFSEQTASDRRDEDVVIVKMNMPRRFKVAPGIPAQSQGDLNTTKRSLNLNLVKAKPNEDEQHRNSVRDEFATVTVNLLSRPKQEGGESEQPENEENDKNYDIRDDVEMQDDEDSSINEEHKELEEYEESDSEESDSESKSARRTKTPSVHNVSVAPLVLPNISLPCSKCSSYVNICHVRSHRDFHTALQTFKFASDFTPQNLKTLIKRRKTLIKTLQESGKQTENGKGFMDKNLQKINTAFEVLKSDLEGTGNTFRVLKTDLSKYALL